MIKVENPLLLIPIEENFSQKSRLSCLLRSKWTSFSFSVDDLKDPHVILASHQEKEVSFSFFVREGFEEMFGTILASTASWSKDGKITLSSLDNFCVETAKKTLQSIGASTVDIFLYPTFKLTPKSVDKEKLELLSQGVTQVKLKDAHILGIF